MKRSINKVLSMFIATIVIFCSCIIPGNAGMISYAADQPVMIQETGNLYDTVYDAVSAAGIQGLSVYTLEITGDVTETKNIILNSNVTIVGLGGEHTITLSGNIGITSQGGSLTLGSGTNTDTLTIMGSVSIKSGDIYVKDGIAIKYSGPGKTALLLSGANVNGSISGGYIEGNSGTGIGLEKGAQLQFISGGVFKGKDEALYLTDAGTRVGMITGGSFYQTDPNTIVHGQAVFIQNNSQIGEISGGHFEAIKNSAMMIIRGAYVDKISGGEFVANRVGTYAANDRNATLWIQSDGYPKAGVGTISGGEFSGAYFGILLLSAGSQVDSITGGTFTGTVALQNDVGCAIGEIIGGTFAGNQGMLNVGVIGNIGGSADILGKTSYGIFNYSGGRIDKISSGTITSLASYGIQNSGAITLISGGTIIGQISAIDCTGMNPGVIDTISDGVFWGKSAEAIALANPLKLEPGLEANTGAGNYWGADGVAFNDDSLVVFPVNTAKEEQYQLSEKTRAVAGLSGISFKYLTLASIPDDDGNTDPPPPPPPPPPVVNPDVTPPAITTDSGIDTGPQGEPPYVTIKDAKIPTADKQRSGKHDISVPQTGDDSDLALMVLTGLVALFVLYLAAAALYSRRKTS